MNEGVQQCPLCQATIPEGQRKCLFCGSILVDTQEEAKTLPTPLALPGDKLITAAYAVMTLSTVALWLGIWRLSPLAPRIPYFVGLLVVAHLAVAILVAVDAKRLDVASHAYSTPKKWFVGTLFLMPLGLFLYSAVRVRCGARDTTRLALALVAAWIISVGIIWFSLQREYVLPSELRRQYEEQLQRTLDVANPDRFDPNATVSPAQ
ncbi:MAG: hypothetical protein ACP5UB_05220 [Candidatus Sumerlaeaceae bacterium]|jgi:hypothetical protein